MAQIPKKRTTGSVPAKGEPKDATVSVDSPAGPRGSTPAGGEPARAGNDSGGNARGAGGRTGSSTLIPSPRQRPVSTGGTAKLQPVAGGARGLSKRASAPTFNSAFGLKGLPLSLKFSVPISLLVVVAMSLFAYIAITTTESRLNSEIVKSGYDQLHALQGFAQKIIREIKTQPPAESDIQTKFDAYVKTQRAADQKFVEELLKRDPRVYDIAIFASFQQTDLPTGAVVQGHENAQFAKPPKETLPVDLPNVDSDVMIYRGGYKFQGGATEQCLYFRMPIRDGANDKDKDKIYVSLNLILSAREIMEEVGALKFKLLMLGLLLTATSVGVAWALARYTVKPIKALVQDMNAVAGGELDHQSPVADTSTDEVGLLATAFNQMTTSLRAGRESERENQRISQELNTAKAIHIKLMPEKLPQLPGIDLFTAYVSAKEVGGDYYDFIPVGDADHLALCVADVSGKGIPGSMVMGTTRTILRMMAVQNLSPAEVLAKTNFHVARDIKRGMFVTCVYCILNVRTREMAVASAGHNPMLIYREATGTVEKVRPNGIALGFDKGPVFNKTIREERIQLQKGDRVVLYTDGVVEAMNEERVEWSEEALDEFTLKNATLPSKEYVRLLIKALDDHKGSAEQHDDITVTTFRVMT